MQVWNQLSHRLFGQETPKNEEPDGSGLQDLFKVGGEGLNQLTEIKANKGGNYGDPKAMQSNIENIESKLDEIGQEVVGLIDARAESMEKFDTDSKLLDGKLTIDFSEEDKDKIKEYVDLLNRHKALTGKDDYALGESAQPVMKRLTSFLMANSHSDEESLLDAQKVVFNKMKSLIENNVKLPKLSSKIQGTTAEDLRRTVFRMLDPSLNAEDKLKDRYKLATAMVKKVGVESFAQNSSINGKSVGVFSAIEKMFSLGGDESGIGEKWLENVKDVYMPIFMNPIDENDSVEFDKDDLVTIRDMRERIAKSSVDSLNSNKRLFKLAEKRTLRDGFETKDRTENLNNIIQSFEKAYTIGKDDRGNDWGREFHYQLGKLSVDFAETKSKIHEADSVLSQLKSTRRSKDGTVLIKGVPVDNLEIDTASEVLKKSLVSAFKDYQAKMTRLQAVEDSTVSSTLNNQGQRVTPAGSGNPQYSLTGQQIFDSLSGSDKYRDGVSRTANDVTVSTTREVDGNSQEVKSTISSDVYNDLLAVLKEKDAKVLDLAPSGTTVTDIVNSINNRRRAMNPQKPALTTGLNSETTQLTEFIETAFNKARNKELHDLKDQVNMFTRADSAKNSENSSFTKALTEMNNGTSTSFADQNINSMNVAQFEQYMDTLIQNNQDKVKDSLVNLGGKQVIELGDSTRDRTLRDTLQAKFKEIKQRETQQLKDDTRFRRELSKAFVKAVHEKGFVSMAAHQANKFLEVITNGDLESGIIDEQGIEEIFNHDSVINPGEPKLADTLVGSYNRNNAMSRAAAILVDGQMAEALDKVIQGSGNRAELPDIIQDSQVIDSQISTNATLKDTIEAVLNKVAELKSDDSSFSYVVDGDDRLALTRDYRPGDELSEKKAQIALRKVVNNTLNAVKTYKGENGKIKGIKDTIYNNRVDVIEGKRKQKFESKVNDIINRFSDLRTDLNLAEAEKYSNATTVSDIVDRDKQSDGHDLSKTGENTVTEMFKTIMSIFAGSKSDDVQQVNQNILDKVSLDESLGENSMAELIQRIMTNLTSVVA